VLMRCKACLQEEGHYLEHLLWFKVTTNNVMTFVRNTQWFAVTSRENGLHFLSCWARCIREACCFLYDENPTYYKKYFL
jgi:hypothetical protein